MFLSFVSWFLLSIDITEGLETGKILWVWCYFEVDGSRRKYIAYPQELFYLTQTTLHLPVGNISYGFGRVWILTCLSCSSRLTSLSSSLSGGIGDPALQKRIWGKQYLNYNSCSANCSLDQHWLVLSWPKVKCFCFVQQPQVFWFILPNFFTFFSRITLFWIYYLNLLFIWAASKFWHIFPVVKLEIYSVFFSVGRAQGNLTMFREGSLLKCST